MNCRLRVVFVATLFLAAALAHASFTPVTVFPNPISFGTVAEDSTGYLTVYLTNSTANTVTISAMSITGTNSSSFTIANPCTTISAGQTCETEATFVPTAVTSYVANLAITVSGSNQPINVVMNGSGGNPLPTITSLSPTSAYVNSSAFTLTVKGTGFVPGATVYFSNAAMTTTYVSATQVTATIPASSLTGTETAWVQVVNPAPGGGSSAISDFFVVALNPYLNAAAPSSIVAATAPSPISISGADFMSGATVLWNGKPVPTTYINSSELQFTPTASQLKSAGIVLLSVSNPSPGGVSPYIDFNVTYPAKVTVLDLPANGLVWDPYAQRIYASLPSSYGINGNTIAVINPATGRVSGYYFAGSEPTQLALSSNSQYLYAGLNGNGSIQRLDLPAFTEDININLGTSSYGYANTALALEVAPNDANTIAVAEGSSNCCGELTGLYFYTGSTQLADNITYPYIEGIEYVNSTTMYGMYGNTVTEIAVSSTGGKSGTEWNNLLDGNFLTYAGGLLYDDYGHAMNPQTSEVVGTYDVSGSGCCSTGLLQPDAAIGRVFYLGTTPFSGNTFGLTSYNLSKFTPIAEVNLSQLSGTPYNLIPWGSDGLAFTVVSGCCGTNTTQLVLVQSATMLLTATSGSNPDPAIQSLSPANIAHGSFNFPLTVNGTGFVPGSQVAWNGTSLAVSYVSASQLTVYVPASAVAASGSASVVVTNSSPGGGSSSATFTIN